MTLAAGAGGTALAAAGLGASPSVWPAAACVLMLGSAFALWQVARLSHIADTVPNAYRGRALALIGGTNRIGMFVGPFAGGLAAELVSLRATFFLQAAVAAVACVVVLLFMRDGVAAPRQHGPRAHTRVARTLVEHRRSFLTAGTAAICLVLVRYSRRLLFPLWGDHIGLGTGEIGLIFSAAFAIDMVMFPVVGVVMDRRGRRWTFVPCLLLFALSLALVPLTAGFASLLAVGLLSGFANGLGSGAVMTLGADLAPRQHSGEFLGVWRLITDTGAVAAPAVVGGLAELATLGTAAVATGGFGVVGAVVMLLLVRETLVREPP
jgi:MFS family permease